MRLDSVAVRSRRGDNVSQMPGIVTRNGLDSVVVEVGGKEEKYSTEFVLSVTLGDVPASFRDGTVFADRGDFASAAASFKLAAGDGEARPVVAAAARLRTAEALLAWGATDATRFAEAAEQAARFIADHPDNRELPHAQMVHARALLLAGKATEAAAAYREVYAKLSGDEAPAGYQRADCFRAGLLAARALLDAKDTLGARELFSALQNTLGPLVAGLEPSSPERVGLTAVLDEAGLGEGFAELAAGNLQPALNFFQNKQRALAPESGASLRYATLLGLGESLLASGKAREAQLLFAEVSALDPTDRDRSARALVGLAEASAALGEPRDRSRPMLEAVVERFGDTPLRARAQQLLDKP